jgi:hypothetical protein
VPKLLSFIGWFVLIIGLGAEVAFESLAWKADRQLQTFDDIVLTDSIRNAGAAVERASAADLKRVELESRMLEIFGPRTLDTTQTTRIAKKLSNLAGVKVDVLVFALGNPWNETKSEESMQFAKAIVSSLGRARADVAGWVSGSCQMASASNVIIDVRGDTPEIYRSHPKY